MGWYTDWFLADESEAEAVASIATDEGHSFDDWPHLAMKSVGEMELMQLWGALRGDPSRLEDVSGGAVFVADEQEGPVVSRVVPEFIASLAALEKPDVDRVAGAWQACEEMAEWDAATVAAVLAEMAEFARRAGREGKPVLQLSVW
jgi:hypothetical protein